MKQNDYVALLDSDVITIKHPITKREVRLHRIIAVKSFKLDNFDFFSKQYSTSELLEQYQQQHKEAQHQYDVIRSAMEELNHTIDASLHDKDKYNKLEVALSVESRKIDTLERKIVQLELELDNKQISSKTIRINTIGGYVQSLDNLDPSTPVWVDNRAKVFDSAKILGGSLVEDNAVIFQNAVVDASHIQGHARIHENAQVVDCCIEDLATIKGNAVLTRAIVQNSSMVFGSAHVEDSVLRVGSCIFGQAQVQNCTLTDVARISGNAHVVSCHLDGGASVNEGTISNETISKINDLRETFFEGSLADIKPCVMTYEGREYRGFATMIPGHAWSLLYADKDLKQIVQTPNGMNLKITAQEAVGRPTF